MKKLSQNILALLFISLVSNGFSQCSIPAYQPAFAHELKLDPNANFNTLYSYENGLNTKYYSPQCGVGTINFDYKTTKGNAQLQMNLELYKTLFDCSGNIISGSTVQVLTTPTVTYGTGSNSNLTVSIDNIPFEANAQYYVKANRRIKFIFWGSWGYETSNTARFVAPTDLPTPSGSFVNALNVDSRTSSSTGWTVDINQLDINSALDFNASATSCESNWFYSISKFELDPWTSSNTVTSGWINGQAGTIDLDGFYTGGLVRNQVYVLQLVAGQGWNVEYYYFEIKDATIGGTISNNGSVSELVIQKGGPSWYATLYERCNFNAVVLNTAGTSSEDSYTITMQAIDAYYNTIGSPSSVSGTGPAPATYNTGNLISPVLGQRYKLTYQVGSPTQTKVFYFRTKLCKQQQKTGDSNSNNSSLLEASAYPNPNTGRFTVTIGNEESFNVAIYDVMGQQIANFTEVEGDLDLDLTDKGTGVYLVKMIQGGQVVTKRVIVK